MKDPKDPIEILRAMVERVKMRRAAEVSPEDQEGQDSAAAAGAELMPDYKGREIYVSFDGDNIGNAVARAEEKDDEATLADISEKINAGQKLFSDFLVQHGGKLIEAGGDEGLGRVNSNALQDIETFRQEYRELTGATVTVGVGEKISEATKARMLGKLRGKDQICYFDQTTEQELEIRSAEQDSEAQKLSQGGLLGGQQPQEQESADQDWQNDYELQEEPQDEEDQGADQQGDEQAEDQQEDGQEEQQPAAEAGSAEDQEEQQPEGDSAEEDQEEQQPEEEIESNDEPYDYTDLPFDVKKDARRHHLANQVARETGANPRFLHLAARHLLKR